ncbi:isochorismatase family protein [Rhizohabitans arisaemae]|uniref:isochorismatase family protein n=1 Tax=Rhizohabitans arisaemae TaxID=2720610 RepID=UPI0024B187D7|nr:isochorismatase family protein [Rhizohabitans arisaemae]
MVAWESLLDDHDREVLRLSGYGRDMGFGARAALLVIDVTVAFCGPEPEPILDSVRRWRNSCGEAAWEAAEHIRRLIAAARDHGVPVIYSKGIEDLATAGRWQDKNARRHEDTPAGNEILPVLAPREGDLVLRKTKPSVFFGTPLLAYLIERGVDTLIATGGSTSGCVRASVVDGFSNGYRMIVPEEAVFDRFAIAHRANLFDMDAKYADVLPVGDVEAALKASPDVDRLKGT